MFLFGISVLYLALPFPIAVYQTVKLYTYPTSNASCSFPSTASGQQAPFRLLIFADPQLEGNTSLRRKRRHGSNVPLQERLVQDAAVDFYNARKRLDLWGNDRYLRHIQQTLRRYVDPSHITVLGDLLGSQWIDDVEFNARADRFWNVVFSGLEIVKTEDLGGNTEKGRVDWSKKLILVAGNHDIGYSGDMTRERVERFERRFGPSNALLTVNFEEYSSKGENSTNIPSLQLVNLNDLTLDQPQLYPALADVSYAFIGKVIGARSPSPSQATVFLTHVPLHKSGQLCNDGPFIQYFPPTEGGGVKEQNFLSDTMSRMLLEWIFGHPLGEDKPEHLKTRGIILTGHDHVGCDTTHYYQKDEISESAEGKWDAVHTPHYDALKAAGAADWEAVREVTVTSMMGDFGGNAGFLSAWFERDKESSGGQWIFKYNSCQFGSSVVWWVVHVVDLITIGFGGLLGLAWLVKSLPRKKPSIGDAKKKQ